MNKENHASNGKSLWPLFLAASLFAPGAALATTSQPGIEMQASVNEQVTVRGKVLDAQGEPVIGANIRVKNHLGGGGRNSNWN